MLVVMELHKEANPHNYNHGALLNLQIVRLGGVLFNGSLSIYLIQENCTQPSFDTIVCHLDPGCMYLTFQVSELGLVVANLAREQPQHEMFNIQAVAENMPLVPLPQGRSSHGVRGAIAACRRAEQWPWVLQLWADNGEGRGDAEMRNSAPGFVSVYQWVGLHHTLEMLLLEERAFTQI